MNITHKAITLNAVQSSCYAILWTTRGLQIVRPNDYIVKAPTGCTWRLKRKVVEQYYHISGVRNE